MNLSGFFKSYLMFHWKGLVDRNRAGCVVICGAPIEGTGDTNIFLLDEIFKGGTGLKVFGLEQDHLIVCKLVHEPLVSLLDLFIKDFKITRTSGVAHAHDPEPLVTEMDLDLFETLDVGDDVVVEGVGCGGGDEGGVVEVPLVGVLGDDVDVFWVDGENVGELGRDEGLDFLNGSGEGTGVHPGNAEGRDGGHGFRFLGTEKRLRVCLMSLSPW